jgi:biotin transport system substrate-specific component
VPKQASPMQISVLSHIFENETLYVLWGIFLIFLTSQINIPLKPVPITLQTFGVMLIGLTFTRAAAIKAITGYLVLGALGLPVFANFHAGYLHLLGPTGGYLLGFLVSVAIMSNVRPFLHNQNIFYIAVNCLIGTAVIFTLGISRLSHFIGFKQAIYSGLIPFIFPGIVKIFLLALAVRYLKNNKNSIE